MILLAAVVAVDVVVLLVAFVLAVLVSLCPAAIVYLVGALEVGLVYFPFFACLSAQCRTVGAILGIFYSLCW